MAHTFNISAGEAEAGRSLRVQDQTRLHWEFQDSQGWKERPCFKNNNNELNKIIVLPEDQCSLYGSDLCLL